MRHALNQEYAHRLSVLEISVLKQPMKQFLYFDLDVKVSTDKPGEVYLRIIDKEGKLRVIAAMYDDTQVDAVMRFLEQSGREPKDTVGQWTTAPGGYDFTVCFRSTDLAKAWLAQL